MTLRKSYFAGAVSLLALISGGAVSGALAQTEPATTLCSGYTIWSQQNGSERKHKDATGTLVAESNNSAGTNGTVTAATTTAGESACAVLAGTDASTTLTFTYDGNTGDRGLVSASTTDSSAKAIVTGGNIAWADPTIASAPSTTPDFTVVQATVGSSATAATTKAEARYMRSTKDPAIVVSGAKASQQATGNTEFMLQGVVAKNEGAGEAIAEITNGVFQFGGETNVADTTTGTNGDSKDHGNYGTVLEASSANGMVSLIVKNSDIALNRTDLGAAPSDLGYAIHGSSLGTSASSGIDLKIDDALASGGAAIKTYSDKTGAIRLEANANSSSSIAHQNPVTATIGSAAASTTAQTLIETAGDESHVFHATRNESNSRAANITLTVQNAELKASGAESHAIFIGKNTSTGVGSALIALNKGATVSASRGASDNSYAIKVENQAATVTIGQSTTGNTGNVTVTGNLSFGDKIDSITIHGGDDGAATPVGVTVTGDIDLGDGADTLSVSGTLVGTVTGGEGDDVVTIGAGATVTEAIFNLGEDDNTVVGSGAGDKTLGAISLGAGDDEIGDDAATPALGANDLLLSGAVALGDGDNTVHAKQVMTAGSITGGAGVDDIDISGAVAGNINLGGGTTNNTLSIGGALSAAVTSAATGTDTVSIQGGAGGVDLGNGANTLTVSGTWTGNYGTCASTGTPPDVTTTCVGGTGVDTLTVESGGSIGGVVDLAGGLNIMTIAGTFTGKVTAGGEVDTITLSGTGSTAGGSLDLGGGNNVIVGSGNGDKALGDITFGVGNDEIGDDAATPAAGANDLRISGSIALGGGNNTVHAKEVTATGSITGGTGEDDIDISGAVAGAIDLGGGTTNNTLAIGGDISATANVKSAATGTDTVKIAGGAGDIDLQGGSNVLEISGEWSGDYETCQTTGGQETCGGVAGTDRIRIIAGGTASGTLNLGGTSSGAGQVNSVTVSGSVGNPGTLSAIVIGGDSDDIVTFAVGGTASGATLQLGGGDNQIVGSGDEDKTLGALTLSDGDETIGDFDSTTQGVNDFIFAGALMLLNGENRVKGKEVTSTGSITGGTGLDVIDITGAVAGDIDLGGDGADNSDPPQRIPTNNTLTIGGALSGDVTSTATGRDEVSIGGGGGDINLGGGANVLDIDSGTWSGNYGCTTTGTPPTTTCAGGAETDTITISAGVTTSGILDLGDGTNSVTVRGTLGGTVTGGAGIDTVTVVGSATASALLDLGAGQNVIVGSGSGDKTLGGITLGGDNDEIGDSNSPTGPASSLILSGAVQLGGGENTVTVKQLNSSGSITGGAGKDTITIDSTASGEINLGGAETDNTLTVRLRLDGDLTSIATGIDTVSFQGGSGDVNLGGGTNNLEIRGDSSPGSSIMWTGDYGECTTTGTPPDETTTCGGDGDDTVTLESVVGVSGTLHLGAGENTVVGSGAGDKTLGMITAGIDDDKIGDSTRQTGPESSLILAGAVDLGEGDNTVTAKRVTSRGSITVGEGLDTILITGDVAGAIDLGGGTKDNTVTILGAFSQEQIQTTDTDGNIITTLEGSPKIESAGTGTDTVSIQGGTGDIDLGDGQNILTVSARWTGNYGECTTSGTPPITTCGEGRDSITVASTATVGRLSAPTRDDRERIDESTGVIGLGNAQDNGGSRLTIDGILTAKVTGSDAADTVTIGQAGSLTMSETIPGLPAVPYNPARDDDPATPDVDESIELPAVAETVVVRRAVLNLGGGDDIVAKAGTEDKSLGAINLGEGNDRVGDDPQTTQGANRFIVEGSLELGAGDNTVWVTEIGQAGSITGGDGMDVINVAGLMSGAIDLGGGDGAAASNTLTIASPIGADITSAAGTDADGVDSTDTVSFQGGSGNVDLGGGINELTISGAWSGSYQTCDPTCSGVAGDDTIILEGLDSRGFELTGILRLGEGANIVKGKGPGDKTLGLVSTGDGANTIGDPDPNLGPLADENQLILNGTVTFGNGANTVRAKEVTALGSIVGGTGKEDIVIARNVQGEINLGGDPSTGTSDNTLAIGGDVVLQEETPIYGPPGVDDNGDPTPPDIIGTTTVIRDAIISAATGTDEISFTRLGANITGNIRLGEGVNILKGNATLYGELVVGSGGDMLGIDPGGADGDVATVADNPSLAAQNMANNLVISGMAQLGSGANKVWIRQVTEDGSLTGGADADQFTISGGVAGAVDLGGGTSNNMLTIGGDLRDISEKDDDGNVTNILSVVTSSATGEDKVSIQGGDGNVNLGGGANMLTVSGQWTGKYGICSSSQDDPPVTTCEGGAGNDALVIVAGASSGGEINLGEGENSIEISGALGGAVKAGGGNDTLTFHEGGVLIGTLDLGGGENEILGLDRQGDKNIGGFILGDGNDVIGDLSPQPADGVNDLVFVGAIDLGNGENRVKGKTVASTGSITGGIDEDTIEISGDVRGVIDLGGDSVNNTGPNAPQPLPTNNTMTIGGAFTKEDPGDVTPMIVSAATGTDTLTLNDGGQNEDGSVSLGGGTNIVTILGTWAGEYIDGPGDDTIVFMSGSTKSLDNLRQITNTNPPHDHFMLGSGNNTIKGIDTLTGKIEFGAGDDTVGVNPYGPNGVKETNPDGTPGGDDLDKEASAEANTLTLGDIDLGDGSNRLWAVTAGNIDAGSGPDFIKLSGSAGGAINLGGDMGGPIDPQNPSANMTSNTLTIAGGLGGDITSAATGTDLVSFNGGTGNIDLGGGANTITVRSATPDDESTPHAQWIGSYTGGDGRDTIDVELNITGTVALGGGSAGNTVTVKGTIGDNITSEAAGVITLDANGDVSEDNSDTVRFNGGSGNIDLGGGTNILYVKSEAENIPHAQWTGSYTGGSGNDTIEVALSVTGNIQLGGDIVDATDPQNPVTTMTDNTVTISGEMGVGGTRADITSSATGVDTVYFNGGTSNIDLGGGTNILSVMSRNAEVPHAQWTGSYRGGDGVDTITVALNTTDKIELGGGETKNTVTVTGAIGGDIISAAAGVITPARDANGDVIRDANGVVVVEADNSDTVRFNGGEGNISLGGGTNRLTVRSATPDDESTPHAQWSGSYTGGSGRDTIDVELSVTGKMDLGGGQAGNTVTIKGEIGDGITSAASNDVVDNNQNVSFDPGNIDDVRFNGGTGDIDLGGGTNVLHVRSENLSDAPHAQWSGSYTGGSGPDTIVVALNVTGDINLGGDYLNLDSLILEPVPTDNTVTISGSIGASGGGQADITSSATGIDSVSFNGGTGDIDLGGGENRLRVRPGSDQVAAVQWSGSYKGGDGLDDIEVALGVTGKVDLGGGDTGNIVRIGGGIGDDITSAATGVIILNAIGNVSEDNSDNVRFNGGEGDINLGGGTNTLFVGSESPDDAPHAQWTGSYTGGSGIDSIEVALNVTGTVDLGGGTAQNTLTVGGTIGNTIRSSSTGLDTVSFYGGTGQVRLGEGVNKLAVGEGDWSGGYIGGSMADDITAKGNVSGLIQLGGDMVDDTDPLNPITVPTSNSAKITGTINGDITSSATRLDDISFNGGIGDISLGGGENILRVRSGQWNGAYTGGSGTDTVEIALNTAGLIDLGGDIVDATDPLNPVTTRTDNIVTIGGEIGANIVSAATGLDQVSFNGGSGSVDLGGGANELSVLSGEWRSGTYTGGDGEDTLSLESGINGLVNLGGGVGNNSMTVRGVISADIISAAVGSDTVISFSGFGMRDGETSRTVSLGGGANQVSLISGSWEEGIYRGGSGDDTLVLKSSARVSLREIDMGAGRNSLFVTGRPAVQRGGGSVVSLSLSGGQLNAGNILYICNEEATLGDIASTPGCASASGGSGNYAYDLSIDADGDDGTGQSSWESIKIGNRDSATQSTISIDGNVTLSAPEFHNLRVQGCGRDPDGSSSSACDTVESDEITVSGNYGITEKTVFELDVSPADTTGDRLVFDSTAKSMSGTGYQRVVTVSLNVTDPTAQSGGKIEIVRVASGSDIEGVRIEGEAEDAPAFTTSTPSSGGGEPTRIGWVISSEAGQSGGTSYFLVPYAPETKSVTGNTPGNQDINLEYGVNNFTIDANWDGNYTGYAHDDTITVTNGVTSTGTLDFGDGSNAIRGRGTAIGTILMGSGDDVIGGPVPDDNLLRLGQVDLGDGNNTLTAISSGSSSVVAGITGGSGTDIISITEDVYGNIDLKGGEMNKLTVGGTVQGDVTSHSAGTGDMMDDFRISGLNGAIDLGEGENLLTIGKSMEGGYTGGSGNDTIILSGGSIVNLRSITPGSGINRVYVEGATGGAAGKSSLFLADAGLGSADYIYICNGKADTAATGCQPNGSSSAFNIELSTQGESDSEAGGSARNTWEIVKVHNAASDKESRLTSRGRIELTDPELRHFRLASNGQTGDLTTVRGSYGITGQTVFEVDISTEAPESDRVIFEGAKSMAGAGFVRTPKISVVVPTAAATAEVGHKVTIFENRSSDISGVMVVGAGRGHQSINGQTFVTFNDQNWFVGSDSSGGVDSYYIEAHAVRSASLLTDQTALLGKHMLSLSKSAKATTTQFRPGDGIQASQSRPSPLTSPTWSRYSVVNESEQLNEDFILEFNQKSTIFSTGVDLLYSETSTSYFVHSIALQYVQSSSDRSVDSNLLGFGYGLKLYREDDAYAGLSVTGTKVSLTKKLPVSDESSASGVSLSAEAGRHFQLTEQLTVSPLLRMFYSRMGAIRFANGNTFSGVQSISGDMGVMFEYAALADDPDSPQQGGAYGGLSLSHDFRSGFDFVETNSLRQNKSPISIEAEKTWLNIDGGFGWNITPGSKIFAEMSLSSVPGSGIKGSRRSVTFGFDAEW